VHIITDYGSPTGDALVEFSSPQDAQAAGAKDKQMMGTHYIEVFASSRDELQLYLHAPTKHSSDSWYYGTHRSRSSNAAAARFDA
jgi:hypothetical protein